MAAIETAITLAAKYGPIFLSFIETGIRGLAAIKEGDEEKVMENLAAAQDRWAKESSELRDAIAARRNA